MAHNCPPNWSSTGDLRTLSNQNQCDISTIFIRVAFGISTFSMLLISILNLSDIFLRWNQNRKKFFDFSKKVNLIPFANQIAMSFNIAAGIVKLIFPQVAVGTDAIISWLFSFALGSLIIIIAIMFSIFVEMSIRQEEFRNEGSILILLL